MDASEPLPLPQKSTLLDLVQRFIQSATSDEEVVATVAFLVNSGQVRLCGAFAGATIVLPSSTNNSHCNSLPLALSL